MYGNNEGQGSVVFANKLLYDTISTRNRIVRNFRTPIAGQNLVRSLKVEVPGGQVFLNRMSIVKRVRTCRLAELLHWSPIISKHRQDSTFPL